MTDVKCPYCGEEQDIDHDDGKGYEEGMTHNQQCSDCEKYFAYTTTISYDYDVEKADCLNEDGEHDWQPTHTTPKEFTKMKCSMCDEERELMDSERIELGIGTKEEYFNKLARKDNEKINI